MNELPVTCAFVNGECIFTGREHCFETPADICLYLGPADEAIQYANHCTYRKDMQHMALAHAQLQRRYDELEDKYMRLSDQFIAAVNDLEDEKAHRENEERRRSAERGVL